MEIELGMKIDLTIVITKRVPKMWVSWLNYQMCKINKDLLENQITFEFVCLINGQCIEGLSVSLPVYYNKHPSGKYIAEMVHKDWYPFYSFSQALSIIKREKVSCCKATDIIEYETNNGKYRMNSNNSNSTIIREAIMKNNNSVYFIKQPLLKIKTVVDETFQSYEFKNQFDEWELNFLNCKLKYLY